MIEPLKVVGSFETGRNDFVVDRVVVVDVVVVDVVDVVDVDVVDVVVVDVVVDVVVEMVSHLNAVIESLPLQFVTSILEPNLYLLGMVIIILILLL